MARYSRDLYERLEEETGLSTGFRAVGHLSIATNEHRMEALRREALFVNGFGVEDQELSPAEIADLWPLLRTDDLVGGLYVADEGRADPVGVAMSLAQGARSGGATVVEECPATGVTVERGRVTGVVTDRGTIECEYVVNAAGMWARQFGALAGVDAPNQAAEHYYLITEPMEGVHRDLPVVEDPDCYGYFRPEGDGLLVGLFEPRGRGLGARRRARRLVLPRAAARLRATGPLRRPRHGPGARARRHRDPQVLLRPRVVHLRRPSTARPRPGARQLLRRGRAQLPRHPDGRRRGHDHRQLDRRRRAPGRRDRLRHRPHLPPRVDPGLPSGAHHRTAGRPLRRRRLPLVAAAHRPQHAPVTVSTTGSSSSAPTSTRRWAGSSSSGSRATTSPSPRPRGTAGVRRSTRWPPSTGRCAMAWASWT